jgi:hypothetical protein
VVDEANRDSLRTICELRATGRRCGAARGGVAGLVDSAFASLGARLGGDVAFRRAVGSNHAAEVPHAGPEQWSDLWPVTDFAGREAGSAAGGG